MQVSALCVVTLTWTLTDAQNRPLDELTQPTEFLLGGTDLWPQIEQALDGKAPGDEARLQLEPEQAFGDYDAQLVCFEPRALFAPQLEPGMCFDGLPAGSTTPGMPTDRIYTVTEVYPEHVVLDANHPLAGIAVRLHMKLLEVRAATEDEVEAGSVGDAVLNVLQTAGAGRLPSAGGAAQ